MAKITGMGDKLIRRVQRHAHFGALFRAPDGASFPGMPLVDIPEAVQLSPVETMDESLVQAYLPAMNSLLEEQEIPVERVEDETAVSGELQHNSPPLQRQTTGKNANVFTAPQGQGSVKSSYVSREKEAPQADIPRVVPRPVVPGESGRKENRPVQVELHPARTVQRKLPENLPSPSAISPANPLRPKDSLPAQPNQPLNTVQGRAVEDQAGSEAGTGEKSAISEADWSRLSQIMRKHKEKDNLEGTLQSNSANEQNLFSTDLEPQPSAKSTEPAQIQRVTENDQSQASQKTEREFEPSLNRESRPIRSWSVEPGNLPKSGAARIQELTSPPVQPKLTTQAVGKTQEEREKISEGEIQFNQVEGGEEEKPVGQTSVQHGEKTQVQRVQRSSEQHLQKHEPLIAGEGTTRLNVSEKHEFPLPKDASFEVNQPYSPEEISQSIPDKPRGESEGENLPENSVPLDQAWPIQRKTGVETPIVQEKDTGQTESQEPLPLVEPGHGEDVKKLLSSVKTGQTSDTTVEIITPRRVRPPVQTVQRAPKQETKLKEPPLPVQTADGQELETYPAQKISPQPMVSTKIGPLPGDLWELMGEESPTLQSIPESLHQPVQKKPARESPIKTPLQLNPADQAAGDENWPVARKVESSNPKQEVSAETQNVIQEEPSGESSGSTAPATDAAGGTPASGQNEPVNDQRVEELARKVYAEIKHRLAIEWERARKIF